MQNDFPLTLNHIRAQVARRATRARGRHAQPRRGAVERASHAELTSASITLARVLAAPGHRAGRPRRRRSPGTTSAISSCTSRSPASGAVLHTLNIRLFEEQLTYIVNHAEDRVIFVDDSLVPILEKLAPSFDSVEHYVLMGDGDDGLAPERAALRGADRASAGPGRLRLPRARRAPGRRALLHERHDRQPEGRALLAPLDQHALLGDADDRRERPLARRPRARGRADVPRQRLGAALRRGARGRRPDPARPLPRRRAAGEADRRRAPDADGLRADDLLRPAALRRRAPRGRPLLADERRVRRLGGAAAADEGLRGAPRRAHLPGLGDDRDQPGRHLLASARGRARRRLLGGARQAGPAAAVGRAAARRRRRRGGAVGRRVDRRDRGARAVDRLAATSATTRARRSSTPAGCARATSRRSTRRASCRSPTARRT